MHSYAEALKDGNGFPIAINNHNGTQLIFTENVSEASASSYQTARPVFEDNLEFPTIQPPVLIQYQWDHYWYLAASQPSQHIFPIDVIESVFRSYPVRGRFPSARRITAINDGSGVKAPGTGTGSCSERGRSLSRGERHIRTEKPSSCQIITTTVTTALPFSRTVPHQNHALLYSTNLVLARHIQVNICCFVYCEVIHWPGLVSLQSELEITS